MYLMAQSSRHIFLLVLIEGTDEFEAHFHAVSLKSIIITVANLNIISSKNNAPYCNYIPIVNILPYTVILYTYIKCLYITVMMASI